MQVFYSQNKLIMTKKDKQFLLKIARQAIAKELGMKPDAAGAGGAFEELEMALAGDVSEVLKGKHGVFVTLEIGGRLRGCIGHIVGHEPLYKAVISNALSAAFEDPRFEGIEKSDMTRIGIEISVLSVPLALEFKSADELKKLLRVGIDGVVLSRDHAKATYLPQVWETFMEENVDELKEHFLASLCVKAGLSPHAWKETGIKIEVYKTDVFKEEP